MGSWTSERLASHREPSLYNGNSVLRIKETKVMRSQWALSKKATLSHRILFKNLNLLALSTYSFHFTNK